MNKPLKEVCQFGYYTFYKKIEKLFKNKQFETVKFEIDNERG